jgi:heme oxygenase
MNIKEATQDLHTELESVPFNQRMFSGEQTASERKSYILGWQVIFQLLDKQVPEFLQRGVHIERDLLALKDVQGHAADAVYDYASSIRHSDNLSAHIYLNYMGFLYGGQIMRKRYPDTSSLYDFEDLSYCRTYIRENHVFAEHDFYVKEVSSAFRWHIEISKQLDNMFLVDK